MGRLRLSMNDMKELIDYASAASTAGVFIQILPDAVLVLTFLWFVIRIYEWIHFRILHGKRNKYEKFL